VSLNISLKKKCICIKDETRETKDKTPRLYLWWSDFNGKKTDAIVGQNSDRCIGYLWNSETLFTRCQTWIFHEFAIQRRENNRRLQMTTAAWPILYFSYSRNCYRMRGNERKARERGRSHSIMVCPNDSWKLIWRLDAARRRANE